MECSTLNEILCYTAFSQHSGIITEEGMKKKIKPERVTICNEKIYAYHESIVVHINSEWLGLHIMKDYPGSSRWSHRHTHIDSTKWTQRVLNLKDRWSWEGKLESAEDGLEGRKWVDWIQNYMYEY